MKATILLTFYLIISPFSRQFAWAQSNSNIHGRITTSDGKPASYISVVIQETQENALTNEQGEFRINRVKPGSYTLKVSGIGLATQEKAVTVQAGQTATVDFSLSESALTLQEITVQGAKPNRFAQKESEFVSKMPLSKLENPQVYSVVTKELLTEQLIFSVDDAIRNTPGVQKMWEATGRGGDGGSFYNMRGFIVQSSLRNGIAGVVTSTIDAANLERLEVIKGPSATLFGGALTSYGGLMNRVTKKPYETFGGEVAYAGGSFGFNRVSVDVNTPLTQDKKLLFRLNSAFNYEGSFQEQGYARSYAVAPSLSYKFNDRLSVNLDAELFFGNSISKQILFFYFPASQLGASRADQLNVDYRKSYMGGGLTQRSRSMNFFGQVNYKLTQNFTSSTNITSSHSYSDGHSPYFYLIPDNMITQKPEDAGKANYLARADQSTGNSTNTLFEIQQNFNGDFRIGSLRNRLVLGLDYLRTDAKQNFFGSSYDVVPLNVPNFDYSGFNGSAMAAKYAAGAPDFTYPIMGITNTYSAYASDVLNLTDQLSLLAALRVDHFSNKGGKEGGDVAGYDQTALSPKFGMVFQPVKDRLSLFANYQNSFKNRGMYSAYDVTAPDSIRQTIARLEQANQIEGGIKLDAWGGKLSATLSYYSIRVQDLLRTDPNPEAAARFAQVQDGTQRSEGIELELIANPAKGLNVVAGFSYNDSKMEKADADVNGRRPATASSPYLANFWISYRLPETAVKGLGFGFGGNYASDNKILNSVSMGEFTLPAYTVLSATAFYERNRYRISVKADNLTDERYWIGYTTMNPQRPRSFSGSLAFKF
jgi:iron complex outermembrane recepter protein